MARPKSKGAYVPLAAQYFMDDAILEAGPDAELLFVRMLSFLASIPSDGFITDRQVAIVAGGLRAPQRRVQALLNVGLIEQVSGGFLVRSWLKWNRSADEVGKLLAKDRERKARKHAEEAGNSERNPDGIRADSSPQSSTEQSSTEQNSLSPDESDDSGTLIPDDWRPNQKHIDKANSLHLDVRREYIRFREHAVRTQRRMTAWNTGFTNWLRKAAEFNQQKQGTPTAQTFAQQRDANALALVAHYEQEEQREQIGDNKAAHLRALGTGR